MDRVFAVYDSRLARGTVVEAPREIVYEAALDTDLIRIWKHDPIVRVLMVARALPDTVARLVRAAPARVPAPASASLAELPDRGFWVRLAVEPGREFVFGAVGHFWGPRVEWRETEAEDFVRFWDRGWGKIAAGFVLHSAGEERTVLVYETRTAATDPLSSVRFRRYWLLLKPGVWLILGRVLAATRREAEGRARAEASASMAATAGRRAA
jgi:hypothetical protein